CFTLDENPSIDGPFHVSWCFTVFQASPPVSLSRCCPGWMFRWSTGEHMTARKVLTDRALRALKPAPQGKRTLTWDGIVPGLAVRITDKGAKSFVLVRRFPGSTDPTPRALGSYGARARALTLEQARDKARGWLALIEKGIDPKAAEQDEQAQRDEE